jgi:UDP-N-acetylmuramyl pentapeptide synthase
MMPFGTRLIWKRTKDYIAFYKPILIGITGSTNSPLAQAAITTALEHEYRMRAISEAAPVTKQNIAVAILGLKPPRTPQHWWSLLSQSLIHELKEVEPEVIPVVMTAEEPGLLDWVSTQVVCQVVIMTDVSTQHTDHFESRELVAHEQAALLATLPTDGIAVLNQDEPLIADLKTTTRAKVITFGYDPQSDIHLQRIQRLPQGALVATIKASGQSWELHFPQLLHGSQVMAVLAALAVAQGLGIPLASVIQPLQLLKPVPRQLQRLVGHQQSTIIDDTAAATPESVTSALEVLRALPAQRRIAIIGDIEGLGKETYTIHKKLGKLAGEIAHIVIGVGELMRLANVEAILVGADTHHFNQSQDVSKWLVDYIQPGDVILVAGAPSMHMEQVVAALVATPKE